MDDWEDEFVLIESQDEHPEQETRNEHLDAPRTPSNDYIFEHYYHNGLLRPILTRYIPIRTVKSIKYGRPCRN